MSGRELAFLLVLTVCVLVACRHARPAADSGIRPPSGGLDPFYTQSLDARGIPILASARVDPAAIFEARRIVNAMLHGRDDLRAAMIERGARRRHR